MYLPPALNARRLCYLADRPFWVRALSIGGWAEIMAWLDDVTLGRGDRDGPPLLSSEESQQWLRSPDGRALLCWIALRDDDICYETAAEIARGASEGEHARLVTILTARRRTSRLQDGNGNDNDNDNDLSQTWCGEGLAELATCVGLDMLGRLSIDQIEWLQSGGKCDEHAEPGFRLRAEMQRKWLDAQRERQAAGDAAEPEPAAVAITPEEADRRRDAMLAAVKAEVAKRDAGLPYGMPSLPDFDEEVV